MSYFKISRTNPATVPQLRPDLDAAMIDHHANGDSSTGSRVAQWKRAGPITQRSVDRNHALLNFFIFSSKSLSYVTDSGFFCFVIFIVIVHRYKIFFLFCVGCGPDNDFPVLCLAIDLIVNKQVIRNHSRAISVSGVFRRCIILVLRAFIASEPS